MTKRRERQSASVLTPEEQEAYRDWYEREVLPEQREQERRKAIVDAEWMG